MSSVATYFWQTFGGYLITLAIALVAVFATQRLADRSDFSQALDGILSEIDINESVSHAILEYVKTQKPDVLPLGPMPRFSMTAFNGFVTGGFGRKVTTGYRDELTGAYMIMSVINEAARRHEDLSFGTVASLGTNPTIRTENLNFIENVIRDSVKPRLTKLKGMNYRK